MIKRSEWVRSSSLSFGEGWGEVYALHLNGLWANGIPFAPGGGVTPNQFYWDKIGNINASCCVLLIQ